MCVCIYKHISLYICVCMFTYNWAIFLVLVFIVIYSVFHYMHTHRRIHTAIKKKQTNRGQRDSSAIKSRFVLPGRSGFGFQYPHCSYLYLQGARCPLWPLWARPLMYNICSTNEHTQLKTQSTSNSLKMYRKEIIGLVSLWLDKWDCPVWVPAS